MIYMNAQVLLNLLNELIEINTMLVELLSPFRKEFLNLIIQEHEC